MLNEDFATTHESLQVVEDPKVSNAKFISPIIYYLVNTWLNKLYYDDNLLIYVRLLFASEERILRETLARGDCRELRRVSRPTQAGRDEQELCCHQDEPSKQSQSRLVSPVRAIDA